MYTKREYQAVIASPVGLLGICVSKNRVTRVDFFWKDEIDEPVILLQSTSPSVQQAVEQLDCYFNDGSASFSLPLKPIGTPFQCRVWDALSRIAPGEVRTYGDIARELKTSPRAVGNACRVNPLPIIVPCHRIVAAGGIGGFSGRREGERLDVKSWLLAHESVTL
ncbi:methylated-DNA--[protein]-cysteine S-methyltransferase [Candidatus Vondammii sp. HM_W22]|uniref:methylated-DNA--[protein]-cysteine S-methyltransferase n=1 Tax=Candidatus Vondammii sp. HM_W22 TaxID=2687299 RepID=UPI001F140D01|nr:methylated-DNA--[protein]-cysteine S-methyltransferase [Candidatus Vondammii sp. HM_W22]